MLLISCSLVLEEIRLTRNIRLQIYFLIVPTRNCYGHWSRIYWRTISLIINSSIYSYTPV